MNIKAMMKKNRREYWQLAGLAYDRTFWRPILSRWLVWLGCSWSVGSVLIFAPFITKAIKAVFQ